MGVVGLVGSLGRRKGERVVKVEVGVLGWGILGS